MRTAILIDGLTLFHSTRDEKIYFQELKEWIKQDDEITIAKYFNSLDNLETKKAFLAHVSKSGFDLHITNTIYNTKEDKYIAHGQDTELIIQAIHNKDEYDKIIIVSGKHDFLPLCEYLTLQGKKVEIIGKKDTIHKLYDKYPQRHIEEFLEKKNIYINE